MAASAPRAGQDNGCSVTALLQYLDRRQHLALDELEEGATAGGNVGNAIGHTVLVDGCQGIAAAGNGERRALGNGLGQRAGALAERSEERRVGKECRSRWSPYR